MDDQSLVFEKDPIVWQGTLEKKGRKRRNWKKRWVVVRGARLLYYSKEPPKGLLKGGVELHGGVFYPDSEHNDKSCMLLKTDHGSRYFYFRAPTAEDKLRWIQVLATHLPKYGGRVDDPQGKYIRNQQAYSSGAPGGSTAASAPAVPASRGAPPAVPGVVGAGGPPPVPRKATVAKPMPAVPPKVETRRGSNPLPPPPKPQEQTLAPPVVPKKKPGLPPVPGGGIGVGAGNVSPRTPPVPVKPRGVTVVADAPPAVPTNAASAPTTPSKPMPVPPPAQSGTARPLPPTQSIASAPVPPPPPPSAAAAVAPPAPPPVPQSAAAVPHAPPAPVAAAVPPVPPAPVAAAAVPVPPPAPQGASAPPPPPPPPPGGPLTAAAPSPLSAAALLKRKEELSSRASQDGGEAVTNRAASGSVRSATTLHDSIANQLASIRASLKNDESDSDSDSGSGWSDSDDDAPPAPQPSTSAQPAQQPTHNAVENNMSGTVANPASTAQLPHAQAAFAYQATAADELSMEAGDKIDIIEKLDDGWWKGRNVKNGTEGVFPGNYVVEVAEENVPTPPGEQDEWVTASFPFEATAEDELSFSAGDRIRVLNRMDDGWCEGEMPDGRRGVFPSNYAS